MSESDVQTYDRLAHVLEDIHSRFPDDAFSKHQRLRGLLADHLPDAEREIRIVLDTIDEGVVDILGHSAAAERGMQIDRLVRRLETSRGIREDIARRVIQAFAFSLGVGELPSSIPVAPSSPTESPDAGSWIGVTEMAPSAAPQPTHAPQPAYAPQPAQAAQPVQSSQPTSATQPAPPPPQGERDAMTSLLDRFGGKKGAMGVIALVVVAAISLNMGETPPADPAQQQVPQVQQGQPVPNQQVPAQPVPGQQVPAAPGQFPQGQPQSAQPAANTASALWYDPYGYIWQMQFSGNQLQGQASLGGDVLRMTGQINPQTSAITYQVFNAASQQIAQGQGQYSDQSHIAFVTYDMNGIVVGQGQFHINHPVQ